MNIEIKRKRCLPLIRGKFGTNTPNLDNSCKDILTISRRSLENAPRSLLDFQKMPRHPEAMFFRHTWAREGAHCIYCNITNKRCSNRSDWHAGHLIHVDSISIDVWLHRTTTPAFGLYGYKLWSMEHSTILWKEHGSFIVMQTRLFYNKMKRQHFLTHVLFATPISKMKPQEQKGLSIHLQQDGLGSDEAGTGWGALLVHFVRACGRQMDAFTVIWFLCLSNCLCFLSSCWKLLNQEGCCFHGSCLSSNSLHLSRWQQEHRAETEQHAWTFARWEAEHVGDDLKAIVQCLF